MFNGIILLKPPNWWILNLVKITGLNADAEFKTREETKHVPCQQMIVYRLPYTTERIKQGVIHRFYPDPADNG